MALSVRLSRSRFAALGSSASMDSAAVSVSALSNNTAPAFELLSDVALHPAFKDEEVERIRKQRLVAILQEGDEPIASTLRVANHVLYGQQPYGFQAIGTTESVKAITQADLKGYWASHYGPKDAALIFAGDLSEAEARKLAEKYFGGWSNEAVSASAALPAAPAPPALPCASSAPSQNPPNTEEPPSHRRPYSPGCAVHPP